MCLHYRVKLNARVLSPYITYTFPYRLWTFGIKFSLTVETTVFNSQQLFPSCLLQIIWVDVFFWNTVYLWLTSNITSMTSAQLAATRSRLTSISSPGTNIAIATTWNCFLTTVDDARTTAGNWRHSFTPWCLLLTPSSPLLVCWLGSTSFSPVERWHFLPCAADSSRRSISDALM